jgi:hypothetical protein
MKISSLLNCLFIVVLAVLFPGFAFADDAKLCVAPLLTRGEHQPFKII